MKSAKTLSSLRKNQHFHIFFFFSFFKSKRKQSFWRVTESAKMINVAGVVSISLFYLLILGVGIWAGRKKEEGNDSEEEVMLAGRSIGLFVGIFTMTGKCSLFFLVPFITLKNCDKEHVACQCFNQITWFLIVLLQRHGSAEVISTAQQKQSTRRDWCGVRLRSATLSAWSSVRKLGVLFPSPCH